MRICFEIFLIFYILLIPLSGANILINENTYSNMKEYIRGSASFSELEKQAQIDKSISEELNIDFVYTDLKECLKYALNDNYDIKIKSKLTAERLWSFRNSVVKIVPDIHYDYSRQDLRGEFLVGGIVPVGVHEIATNLYFNFEWNWFNKGRYFFDVFQNNYLLRKAKSEQKFTTEETLLKTSLAYYNLLLAKLEIEEYRTNLFELTYYKEIAEARFRAGLDRKYDLKRAEADLAQAQMNYQSSLNNLRMKQAELSSVIGLDILSPVYPFEDNVLVRKLFINKFDVEELFEIALSTREDIKAIQSKIKSDIIKKYSNLTDVLPNFVLSYQDGFAGTRRTGLRENSTLIFTSTISVGKNLLTGTLTKMKAEDSLIKSEEYELEKKKQEIKTLILSSLLKSDNALNSIKASEEEFEASKESLALAIGSYKSGQGAFSDVLDAQTIKTKAKLNVIRNSIDYNKSQLQLLFETGLISYNSVLEGYTPKYQ